MDRPGGLAEGWEDVPLGEVATFTRGITFPASAKATAQDYGLIPCLRTANVQHEVDWSDLIYVPESFVKRPDLLTRPGDILISMANSLELVGKVALVDSDPPRSTFGGFISAIRPSARTVPQYLFYVLRSSEMQQAMRETASRSVNIANLALSRIGGLTIPLPPLPEQRRIAEKIERLLAQSRTAREALERIPPLLKRFRQSILAKAFRGELTERDPSDELAYVLLERIRQERRRKWEQDLRAKGKDPRKVKYVEPDPPDISAPPELPEGWSWVRLEDTLDSHRGGVWGEETPDGYGYPVLRSTDMRGGRLSFGNVARCAISESVARDAALMTGDIIVSKSSGSPHLVGLAVLFEGSPDGQTYLCSNFTMRLRPNPDIVVSDYLLRFLESSKAMSDRRAMAQDTTGLRNLKVREYLSQMVPVAPVGEQRLIATKVAHLFGQADAIEVAVSKAQRRTKHADQRVLARTFRGEL